MSSNITHKIRKAWTTIRKLSNDPTTANPTCLVSVNRVAHQLFANGSVTKSPKLKCSLLLPII